ncbi:MAG: hypothetical protein J3R72DRAFT_485549 [Linnemannia gamsii]|nr:MAG: hypothetical protein J3R72DRAFT_485549 [Linnemannia gamsii]
MAVCDTGGEELHYPLEPKIAEHPELFTSCSSIRETLWLLLYRHHLLGAFSTVLENDVQLVEAVFGRIKLFGGAASTVLCNNNAKRTDG